jgi:DNA-binding HxlR family transcriptional regulator
MDSYRQFCPVAKAAELLTRKWTPLVVRELLQGSHRYNDLKRGLPAISPTLLSRRLTELEQAGVVRRVRPEEGDYWEYRLTEAGEELRPVIEGLGKWGKRWSRAELSEDDLDAGLLMWDLHRRLPEDRLPDERAVVRFRFRDAPEEERDFWLVLDEGDVDLCIDDRGLDVDLRVVTDVRTLTSVWLGDAPLSRAVKRRKIRLRGPEELRRAFPGWLGLSLFADVERQRRG